MDVTLLIWLTLPEPFVPYSATVTADNLAGPGDPTDHDFFTREGGLLLSLDSDIILHHTTHHHLVDVSLTDTTVASLSTVWVELCCCPTF